jgi:hypothetical protein
MLLQDDEGSVLVVLARDVGAHGAKLLELGLHVVGWRLHVRLDAREVLDAVHFGPGVADNLHSFGEKAIAILRGQMLILSFGVTYETEQGGEGLLLGQVARSSQDDNHGVGGELLGASTVSIGDQAE